MQTQKVQPSQVDAFRLEDFILEFVILYII